MGTAKRFPIELLQEVAERFEDILKGKLEGTGIVDVGCNWFSEWEIDCTVGRRFRIACEGAACGEEINAVNEKYAIGVEASINAQRFTLTVEPWLCGGCDCLVGVELRVGFKVDVHALEDEKYRDCLLDEIAEVVSIILKKL